MWVAGGRSWCLEIPLFPLHANLQLPSSCSFLTRGLEQTQDTPLPSIPYPLGWLILATPLLCFVFSSVEKAPVLRAPEFMFSVA